MKMDMSQYLDIFLEESREHLSNLNQSLLELEKNQGDLSSLNEIFRAAHTLKGMSSTMGYEDLADLTHHMEDVLADLKEGVLKVNTTVVDTLFKCFDRIQVIIDKIENTSSGEYDNMDLINVLENIKTGNYEAAAATEIAVDPPVITEDPNPLEFNNYDIAVIKEAAGKNFSIYHIRVEVDRDCLMKLVRAFMVFKTLEEDSEIIKSVPAAQDLDEGKFDRFIDLVVVTQSEASDLTKRLSSISEVRPVYVEPVELDNITTTDVHKSTANREEHDQHSMDEHKKHHKVKQTVRVDIERLDNLMNLVGELVMHKGRLEQIGSTQKLSDLNETIEQIDRVSSDLQSVVMKVRMVPIEQVFNRFPRMVRDLAKELNKEVDFIIEGKETELDRTVIDEIGDPLVHLLRNAVDHGIESPAERVSNGKLSQGTVMLRARHEGNNVYIEVEDDGKGINIAKVKQKAIEKGFIPAHESENLSEAEVINLLFDAGFSTANDVTDVSGRGVGLDVVKNKIESLNGEIQVDNRPGAGTRFKIKLPLTLAIIQALMVAVRNEIYAIPLSSVDETTMITCDDIKMVQNQEVIMLRGNVLPLFRLSTLLEIPGGEGENGNDMYVVVVRKAEKQIGLVVDTLIGQQEIVIKSLGKLLGGVPGIAGAIVAGDGNVRLILDIATLF